MKLEELAGFPIAVFWCAILSHAARHFCFRPCRYIPGASLPSAIPISSSVLTSAAGAARFRGLYRPLAGAVLTPCGRLKLRSARGGGNPKDLAESAVARPTASIRSPLRANYEKMARNYIMLLCGSPRNSVLRCCYSQGCRTKDAPAAINYGRTLRKGRQNPEKAYSAGAA